MHNNFIYAVASIIDEKTKFNCAKVSDELYQEFELLNLDLDTRRLFQWYWFSEDAQVGPIIYSAENILKAEKENNYLKNGIIQIGYCPNGDEIFLRVKDSSVLYWSHDEAEYSEANNKDENALFVTYNRVEYLLMNICNGNFIPWDSSSAREYFDLYNGK